MTKLASVKRHVVILPLCLALAAIVFAQAPQHGVTLTWNASASPNVTYNVYRAAAAAGPFAKLGNTTALTYFDPTGALNGATEFYQVTALDALGVESAPSNQISVVTIGNPKAPPGLAGVAN